MDERAAMLGRIRSSLGRNRGMLEEMATLAQSPHPHGPFIRGNADAVEQFMAELRALQGHPHRCADVGVARETLIEILLMLKAERVLHWDERELPIDNLQAILEQCGAESANGDVLGAVDRKQHLEALDDVPVCISGVDAAVAESATMVVVSGPGRGRLASLLPPVHIALLPSRLIVPTLPEAWSLLRTNFGDDVALRSANISLITGPSRTADIEQTLSLGVHGPKEVHVIVIDG